MFSEQFPEVGNYGEQKKSNNADMNIHKAFVLISGSVDHLQLNYGLYVCRI